MPALALAVLVACKAYVHPPLRLIIWFLAAVAVVFGASNYLADRHINNIVIYNSFGLAENLFLTSLLVALAPPSEVKRYAIATMLGYGVLFLLQVTTDHRFFVHYSSIIMLSSAVSQLLCVVFFAHLLRQKTILAAMDFYWFWMLATFFIFHTGTLVLEFGYWLYSGKSNTGTKYIWLMYDVLLLTKYGTIMVIGYKISRRLTVSSH